MLWLWYRLAAVALIRPLAWEPPYAVRAAQEIATTATTTTTTKRQKTKKKKNEKTTYIKQKQTKTNKQKPYKREDKALGLYLKGHWGAMQGLQATERHGES